MEEWLLYHTLLGFNKFRLYDNTGSIGDASSPFLQKYQGSRTKYGLPVVSTESSDEEINLIVKEICKKFKVELISWPSLYYTNEVQIKAVIDHIRSDDSEYTAFIDMDEYICIEDYSNIHDFVKKELEDNGYCGVKMRQQKMQHILKAKMSKKRIWELNETFEMNTKNWAPKSLVKTKFALPGANIHEVGCGGEILNQPEGKIIRINHYNTNEYQMHWLKNNHKTIDAGVDFEKLQLGSSSDHYMDKFKEKMSSWNYVNLEEE